MNNVRIIARLDVKGPNLIKGIHLEGLRKIGDPNAFAKKYYAQGADEILYVDAVASLYGRDNLLHIVRRTTDEVFIPITVAGGVRNIGDAKEILRSGADKVAVNTAALKRPELITEISKKFGSQCMVLSIEAKNTSPYKWEAYCENGREKTGVDVTEWARRGCELGAGEILLTSVDMEGTGKGFDLELIRAVTSVVPIPVIVSGGMGNCDDFEKAVKEGLTEAVAIASGLHYGKMTIPEIRSEAIKRNIKVRHCDM